MRCARCCKEENCGIYSIRAIPICQECLNQIVMEWYVRFEEFGELVGS